MARVTLAYPHAAGGPDETVELPDNEATQLVRDGLARWPDAQPEGPAQAPQADQKEDA